MAPSSARIARGQAGLPGVTGCKARSARRIFTPFYGENAPRLPKHLRLLSRRAEFLVRARRAHARGRVRQETARRKIAGDDFSEVVHSDARLLRSGNVAAR